MQDKIFLYGYTGNGIIPSITYSFDIDDKNRYIINSFIKEMSDYNIIPNNEIENILDKLNINIDNIDLSCYRWHLT